MTSKNVETVFFDLDDTLLGNNMEHFLPRYFALLGEYARPIFADRDQLLQELLHGTQAMIANPDPGRTNREKFWRTFSERTGVAREEAEPFFNRFYEEEFPKLQAVTERKPVARDLVCACFERGLQVAIATNPLFPRRAIEHRLAWAGLPPAEFDFALVTSYENMHAAKPHAAYYREILTRVGAQPETTLMVGDHWENDIAPAAALGMRTYWIAPEGAELPAPLVEEGLLIGAGSLETFHRWLFGEQGAASPNAATDGAS
ncbi:MAG: HAD family hydrolase [Candidatus Promineifilaceae bacterium]|nr:HAD family hydrolase [Candidatus Promineifilaceae bacterium]